MIIRVPATSANIGPGFDSLGIAISRYLDIHVLEESHQWVIEHDLGDVPHDQENLLIQTALKIAPNIKAHRIKMVSEIPLARGLGSSSSVIVAGIELANQLADLKLSQERKLTIATQIEGHPDNVAPAIFGQMVIASQFAGQLDYVKAAFPDVSLIAFIPNYELKTSDSRGVLPQQLSYKQAVSASSIANVAIAALLTGDMEKAGRAIENDQFHEVYRQKLVKEFQEIKLVSKKNGAFATYLSGAGPTVVSLCPNQKAAQLLEELTKLQLNGEICQLTIDNEGLRVL
ncbi:homoserine kinase [Streptococcus iniae]|uniref:Homoserine kinase n=1 Tax=Streptococcus iniae TaxID=1346 RepID=A0A3L8GIA5_STRIN|nr:homoserine kinase [Streptococcus iniae]AGM98905.1 homoserine kinase [Streptococcus iniae SF1]AJG26022.1 serine kinase [Streptococcus iniae]APD31899.1 homoserine kinase [Streptococcus iniae]ASL34842.1 homoserine kinase [Streptococcus iniae]ATX39818.1 Homoserine kinase [Streptococcus iniae]